MFFVPSLKVQFKHDWIFLGWNDRYRCFIFSTPAILRYREIPSENFFKICTRRVIAETAPFIRTVRLAKKYRGIYAYEKFSKRVIGDEESRRRSRGATGSEKIKRSVGTRAAEEAAREEREKIDAMYPGVWDGLEWNGWTGGWIARWNLWRGSMRTPCPGRCRAFYVLHAALPLAFFESRA